MGEPVTVAATAQNTREQIPIPNPAPTPTLPPQPPRNNKRPLDSNVQVHFSSWYKMRAVVRDLRPDFVEVLRTPDFRNCKAAHDVQEQVKLLMELHKQLTAEKASMSMAECNGLSESQPLSAENGLPQKAEEHSQPHPDQVFVTPSENKSTDTGIVYEKQQHEAGVIQGTYMVGGSAFGWNFITFGDSKPVYYGRAKESMRIAQANVETVEKQSSTEYEVLEDTSRLDGPAWHPDA